MTRDSRSCWTDPAWRAEILAWATDRLVALGRRVEGPAEQPHVRPWSTVFRIPTDVGPVWCKAPGPAMAHEAALLTDFAAWGTPHIVPPLVVEPERGWILLPDGGPTMRQTRPAGTGDQDLGAWERILPAYAALQRSTESRTADLLAAGVPDGRPDTISATLVGLLDMDALWGDDRIEPNDRPAARSTRHRLRQLAPRIGDAAAQLAGSGIAPTIQHDDLHGGNIFAGAAGIRFFDWGDAVVAHPFATLTVTLNSIAHITGLASGATKLRRVRDAYLEAWTDVGSPTDLGPTVELALDLGRIGRAAAWSRALDGVPPDEMDCHGGAPVGWLADLVERLDRRPTA